RLSGDRMPRRSGRARQSVGGEMGIVEEAVAAVRAGKPVVLPTDTVYGLCASPYRYEPADRVYRLKHRPPELPSALMASGLEMLFECVPELRGRAGTIARTLLPGPYTLVLPNPARRYRWLTGSRAEAIGVRVPELPAAAQRVLAAVGYVLATSANEPGGPDQVSLADVADRIRQAVAAELD